MNKTQLENFNENLPHLKEILSSIVDKLGYEVVEISSSISYSQINLNIFIFKLGGIDFNDCEIVHNAVSEKLDELEKELPEEYILNVSSPGLDRLISSNDDFRRNLNQDIEIFVENNAKKEKLHGVLMEYDDETIKIQNKNQKIFIVERKTIAKARPFVKF